MTRYRSHSFMLAFRRSNHSQHFPSSCSVSCTSNLPGTEIRETDVPFHTESHPLKGCRKPFRPTVKEISESVPFFPTKRLPYGKRLILSPLLSLTTVDTFNGA